MTKAALEAEIVALNAKVAAMEAEMVDFRVHLDLPKFCGPDNGWIAVSDVLARLRRVDVAALTAYEAA